MRARPFSRLGVLVAAAAAITASSARAETVRTLRQELSGGDLARFAVENLAGTMRVTAGGDRVSAVATIHAADEELASEVRFERVAGEGGAPALRVRYPVRHRTLRYRVGSRHVRSGGLDLFSGNTYRYDGHRYRVSSRHGVLLYADVEVRVPARLAEATFRNLAGRIEATGVEGALVFSVLDADARLERLSGTIRTRGTSGDVLARDLAGAFSFQSTSGDCDLDGFRGSELSFRASSGDLRLRRLAADRLETETSSGDARIADADVGEFSARAGSGDIQLELAGARLRGARVHTGSGDVRLRLPDAAAFEVRADQGSGDFHNGFRDVVATMDGDRIVGYRHGGADGARIEVETGSGDLTISPR
jgi:hypothetical protein